MEILGIGPLELFFILLIALIVLGPRDMVKAGTTLGRFLRKVVTSSEWRTIQKASKELRYLPNRLMREASIEDLSNDLKDMNKIGGQITNEVKKIEMDLSSWTTTPFESEPVKEPEAVENPPVHIEENPDKPNNSV